MVDYFFDTYAIIELLKHNPAYAKYNDYPLVTSMLNKIEVGWWALQSYGKEFAELMLDSLSHPVELSDELIMKALLFRSQEKKRDVSYADAIGYTYARESGLRFLTGDRQFKDLPGVEFVPAKATRER